MFNSHFTPKPGILHRTPSSDALDRCYSAFARAKDEAGSTHDANTLTTARENAVQRHVDAFMTEPQAAQIAAKANRLLFRNFQAGGFSPQFSRTVNSCIERRLGATVPYFSDLKQVVKMQMGEDFKKKTIESTKAQARAAWSLLNAADSPSAAIVGSAIDAAIDAVFEKLPLMLLKTVNLRSELSDQEVIDIIRSPNQAVLADGTRRMRQDITSGKIDVNAAAAAVVDFISQESASVEPDLEFDRFLRACGLKALMRPMLEAMAFRLIRPLDPEKLEAGFLQMFKPLVLEYFKDLDVAAYEAYAKTTNIAEIQQKASKLLEKLNDSWSKALELKLQNKLNKI
jgi:hypothetical protein